MRRTQAPRRACLSWPPSCRGWRFACFWRDGADRYVEAALGLASEPAGLDIFHQQGTGPVLGVGQTLMQHLHDRQAGVEPDEIGQFGLLGAASACAPGM